MKFTIPGPPMGKQRPRVAGGHAFTPAKTVNYETLVKECFMIEYPRHTPILTAVEMEIVIFYPIPKSISKKKTAEMLAGIIRPTKKPDCDNIIKIICDALNQMAYKDDSQVVSIKAEKHYSDRPRVEVGMEAIE